MVLFQVEMEVSGVSKIFNSLGPVDAFKRPKIFVFSKKKKKKKIDPNRFPTYLVGLFESPTSYQPGYHV